MTAPNDWDVECRRERAWQAPAALKLADEIDRVLTDAYAPHGGIGDDPQEVCAKWFRINADRIAAALREQAAEIERLRARLLSAAGDDLCRLTPEETFISSCRQFWKQKAGEGGVLPNCLTLAQLVAENERLREVLASVKAALARLTEPSGNFSSQ